MNNATIIIETVIKFILLLIFFKITNATVNTINPMNIKTVILVFLFANLF